MRINTKYKIEETHVKKTLDIIKSWGFGPAMDMAYDKALKILEREPESILCVVLLAWSYNLLTDSRAVETKWQANDLRLLSSFYRKVAHKVYWHQLQHNQIGELPDFIQKV